LDEAEAAVARDLDELRVEMDAAIDATTAVGLYKLNPVDPQLEKCPVSTLELMWSSEKPVSSLCFQMQLAPLRYGSQSRKRRRSARGGGCQAARGGAVQFELCFTLSLKAPDFNP
jgi:hypothetical protein